MNHLHTPLPGARRQQGAAALIVTALLFFAMVLVAVFVNRNLVFEQRASANQYRSTQAFEAAEAGAEWALAQLNNPQRVGPDCQPTADTTATSFRGRYLSHHDGVFTPATWTDGGTAAALQPTCVRSDAGWSCSCPLRGRPVLETPSGDGPFPAFTLQFVAGDKPGSVRLLATGCTSLAGLCMPGSASGTDAIARVDVTLGLFPGLRTEPAAALTARTSIDADSAAFGAHNADAATGLALHAGSGIAASLARLSGPAGAAAAAATVANDPSLAAQTTGQLFASYFGLDKERWRNQPVVRRIRCSTDCSSVIGTAIASRDDNTLLWIDGDLTLDGPVSLGSAARPAVIVVDGSTRLRGAVDIHGLLYAGSLRWEDTPAPGAVLRGAAVSENGYAGNGTPDLVRDASVLAALKNNSGSFVRVNGGWRDF